MADRHPLHRFMENPSETAGIDEGDPLAARVRWLGAQNETERQVILRELQAFEEETAQLTARWMEETERLDDQIAALQKEINEGEASAFRQPSRLGRPRLPYTWKLRGCVALIVCLLFCEAWQFAIPYYNQIGINISNLSAEWRRNPMGIITGIGFAVGAFACLFGCAHLIFKLSLSIYNDRLQGEKR